MPNANKLFLLDTMALLYRAHFALHRHARTNSKGLEVSGLLGFTNTILQILQKEKPTYIVAALDTPAPTWRKKIYPAYKAHREKQPEAISTSLPYLNTILEAFGIPYIGMSGYEADDIIGTLQVQATQKSIATYMVSLDKDLGQLVGKQCYLYRPSTGGASAAIWGISETLNHWGIDRIAQIPDMLALWGDASDNIPGVPKIGFKTAQKLLQQFGSLERLLTNKGQLAPALQASLRAHEQQALLSKRLATIDRDVPLDFDIAQHAYQGFQVALLKPLLQELEFRTIAKRLFPEKKNPRQGSIFTSKSSQEGLSPTLAPLATWKSQSKDYTCLTDTNKIAAYVRLLQAQGFFCLDTETTSLSPYSATLLGISLAYRPHEACFIPMPTDEVQAKELKKLLQPLLQDPHLRKIGQNLKYDLLVLQKHGLVVEGPFFDTMVAHHLLAPNTRHNLTALANTYLHYAPIEIESLIGKKDKHKKQKKLSEVPVEDLVIYACEDADITLQIYEKLAPLLEAEDLDRLFYTLEMPLLPVLAKMEYRGIAIDTDILHTISKEFTAELAKLEAGIHDMAGRVFNISSPKQLGEVLFDQLRIVENPPKTPTGQYATNEAVLSRYSQKHPIVQTIRTYREIKKLQSTYVDTLPQLLEADGRLHTSFQQAVVSTGRLSSTNPNVQNIPIRTERGKSIRKAFVAGSPSQVLFCVDYDQIELRIMTHFAQDEAMLAAFQADKDVHTMTATQLFQVQEEGVTPEMRRKAKMVNFGIIYGISAFGLAQRLEIARSDARAIIEAYFRQFPGIQAYMASAIEGVRATGYATTLLGRKRFLPDIHSQNATMRGFAERNAINMPIQGTAAELIQMAMIQIEAWILQHQIPAKMLLQVHDELIFEVDKEAVQQVKNNIPALMAQALPLDVPITVTSGIGHDWLEAH